MKKFISLSGGVESTTLAFLFGKGSTALFCDAGGEHEKMYERIDYLESRLKIIHEGDFEIVKLKGQSKHKGVVYDSLPDLISAYKFMPSGQNRFCTRIFKIEPIDKYLKGFDECELMIGLNADEENSRDGNWGLLSNVKYTYPLIESGLTRSDCEEILRANNLHPNMPPYALRGGCKFCFYKTEKEYKALYYLNRDEFESNMKLEESIQDKRKSFFSIMPSGKSLRQLAKECDSEINFDFDLIYSDYNKSNTTCGAFCNR